MYLAAVGGHCASGGHLHFLWWNVTQIAFLRCILGEQPLRRSALNKADDRALIDQMQQGRADALGVLFGRYGRLVFTVARKILSNDAEAEDLTQEVFLEIYKRAGLYDAGKGSVKIWLLQYAYHRSFNRRKYLALRSFYDTSPTMTLTHLEIAAEEDGHDSLNSIEWRQQLQRGMQELTDKERHIIELVSLDGLTMREATSRTRESYSTCRNHYYRGLKKLKDFFRRIELHSTREVKDGRSRMV
jgi:RNA polymerase sigma-70 factor (ECF subfamily)